MAKTRRSRRAGTATPAADDIRVLAREAAIAAVAKLAELANSEDERIALAASQELLNRAFGRIAAAGNDEQSGAARPLVVKIVRFGAEHADAAPNPPRPEGGA